MLFTNITYRRIQSRQMQHACLYGTFLIIPGNTGSNSNVIIQQLIQPLIASRQTKYAQAIDLGLLLCNHVKSKINLSNRTDRFMKGIVQ